MTLENDPGHFYPTPPRKSYNPFDSDDETLDSPGLKSESVYTKEDYIGFDLKTFERSANPATFRVDHGDFSWEEAVLGQPAVNASANDHTGLFETDSQLYMDKNVTECELPEFIVRCKESTYQSVKDIGIDEGVPTHNKIWVPSSKEERKDPSAFLALNDKSNEAVYVEKNSDELDALEAPNSKLGGDLQKVAALYPSVDPSADGLNQETLSGEHLVHEFGDDNSPKITEVKFDLQAGASFPGDCAGKAAETTPGCFVNDVADSQPAAETDKIKDACKQGEPDFISGDGADHDDTEEKKGNNISLDKVDNIVFHNPVAGETPSKHSTEHGEDKVKTDECPTEEESLPGSSEHVAAQESAYSSDSNKMTCNSKVESGSITVDFNSSTNSDPGKQEDDPQNDEVAKPPATQTMTRHEEGGSGCSVVATLEPRLHGETSFSASFPAPPPSSVTFSGPVAYSGSISLRSESSAGSTRSFAFPVLQTEWNSSPVRMAKPDQGHFRKHRGWVQALICCRF